MSLIFSLFPNLRNSHKFHVFLIIIPIPVVKYYSRQKFAKIALDARRFSYFARFCCSLFWCAAIACFCKQYCYMLRGQPVVLIWPAFPPTREQIGEMVKAHV